ncbi:hypothetical protein [Paraburkholderia mimosarum]|uniref:hypothetical protein n=1 Tax=Paraburkholderia mimosarum TaxID=312026 RepID=UPI001EE1A13A|nr:hypothetical protein [Paraburkholderia mimosarum]
MPHRRHLTRHVGTALRKTNKTGDGTIASEADAGDAKVLRLQITHVLGVGGGAWSGPKATTVSADLIEGGKATRHTKINRWSVGGVWGRVQGKLFDSRPHDHRDQQGPEPLGARSVL